MKNLTKKCCCPCHKAMGVLVVLFGLSFLLERLGLISHEAASLAWPIFIVLAGVKMIAKDCCKCCHGDKSGGEGECCDEDKSGHPHNH